MVEEPRPRCLNHVLIFELCLTLSFLCFISCSLIDRRGYIQPDTPQPAAPSNGITMYGAMQSQSDMVGTAHIGAMVPCDAFSSSDMPSDPIIYAQENALVEGTAGSSM